MKKITLLSVLMMITSIGFSQTLPYTFDESTDPSYYFTGFDVGFSLTTDPEDASNPVGQITGNGSNFDTLQTIGLLEENIDLSDDSNNTITFRWRAVNGTGSGSHLLKFELDGNNPVELPFTSTGTGWQTISLDFGPGLGIYNNLIIFPDFNNAGNDVYLIDDLAGGTNVAPPPPATAAFPIDFESAEDTFNCFDCGFSIVTDSGDNVGSISGTNAFFDTAQLPLGTLLDLSDDSNNTITFRIKPVNGTGSGSHLLKFELGSSTTELPFTTTGTDWQDISIDFPAGLGTYDLVVIFPDFNDSAVDTYLIDDIAGGTNVVPLEDPEAAPIPNAPNGEVYSIYNDTNGYTTVFPVQYPFGTLGGEPDLDPGTGVNTALKFDFNFAGYGQGEGGPDDVSAYGFVNFNYWAEPGIPGFQFRMISNNGGVTEHTYEIGTQEAVVTGQWTQVSIPMSYFTGIGFSSANFFQWKCDPFMQQTAQGGIVYIDNIILTLNPLSVDEFNTSQFTVFPNPAKDKWGINGTKIIKTITLFDVSGKQVLSISPNNNEAQIDASKLNSGIYFAKINSENGTETIKLIKN